jgi:ribonuclease HI
MESASGKPGRGNSDALVLFDGAFLSGIGRLRYTGCKDMRQPPGVKQECRVRAARREEAMKEVTIYTDGACSGNPGPGGWAAVLMHNEHRKELSGGEKLTTNNRMELTAVIEALKRLKEPCRVKVHSDSAYLVNCFRQGWYRAWQMNGWKNSKNEPVENRDLWEELLRLMDIHQVEYVKVKGHSDSEWNNRCDLLAREAIKNLP